MSDVFAHMPEFSLPIEVNLLLGCNFSIVLWNCRWIWFNAGYTFFVASILFSEQIVSVDASWNIPIIGFLSCTKFASGELSTKT